MFDTTQLNYNSQQVHIDTRGIEAQLGKLSNTFSKNNLINNPIARKALFIQYKKYLKYIKDRNKLMDDLACSKLQCPAIEVKNCWNCYHSRFPIPQTKYNEEHLNQQCRIYWIDFEDKKLEFITKSLAHIDKSTPCEHWLYRPVGEKAELEIECYNEKIKNAPKLFELNQDEFDKLGRIMMLAEYGEEEKEE